MLEVVQVAGAENLAARLAEAVGVLGVGHHAAVGGKQRQLASTVIQLLVGLLEQVLDKIQSQIVARHAEELAVVDDRHVERGGQHHLAVELIRRRVDHAVFLGALRAQVERAFGHAGGQQFVAFHHGRAQGRDYRGAIGLAVPPGHKAPGLVVASVGLALVQVIVAVEGAGLPADIEIQQLGVAHQGLPDQVGEFFATDIQLRGTAGVGLGHQHVGAGQFTGGGQGVFQLALDLAGLGVGQGNQAFVDDFFQQRLGALLHQRFGSGAGKQCIQHQCHHHDQHTGTGQGGHRKLDGFEFHGNSKVYGLRLSLAYRQSCNKALACYKQRVLSAIMQVHGCCDWIGSRVAWAPYCAGESQWAGCYV